MKFRISIIEYVLNLWLLYLEKKWGLFSFVEEFFFIWNRILIKNIICFDVYCLWIFILVYVIMGIKFGL